MSPPARGGAPVRCPGEEALSALRNPFIFGNLDVVTEGEMDPGGDRLSAVPLDDTCLAFPHHRLIAINVPGHPAVHTSAMNCPVEEVRIDVGQIDAAALFSDDDEELQRVVMIGWRSTAPHVGLPPEPATGMAVMTNKPAEAGAEVTR
jgi:hypothetical protein